MKAICYDINGSNQGEQSLPDWLFDGVVNEDVMHQAVSYTHLTLPTKREV